MSTQLEQTAAKAKADRTLRFTSLVHLLAPAFLIETWRQMNRCGASGVDGETTTEFERDLHARDRSAPRRVCKHDRYDDRAVRLITFDYTICTTTPSGSLM
jgi:RNA-directed DNA polymerase